MPHKISDDLTIMITAGHGSCIGLDKYNNLIIYDQFDNRTNLGPLTQQRAREIGEYLNRLAIHTPEK
jgi:hypothetical protein